MVGRTSEVLQARSLASNARAHVQADAAELRSGYEKVQYCFENVTKAIEYVKIR